MKNTGFLLLFIVFFVKPINAQPTSNDGNYTRVNLTFYNYKKDIIQFVKEKNTIRSNDCKYLIEFVEMESNKKSKNINYYSSIDDNYNLSVSYQSYDKDKKKILKVTICKKKKKMKILFKIHKRSKSFIPWNINMFLSFKKGTYEVINPKKPELIKIRGN